MGNTEHWVQVDTAFPNQQQLLSQLILIEQQTHTHNHLGKHQIYRFKTQPYDILMKHIRIFSPNNAKYVEYAQTAKAIASLVDHKNIARIHSINICTKSNICMKQISIESYVNYYAINMEQVINKRKKLDVRLTSNELWYMVNSLSEVSIYLKSLKIYFGLYLAKNIYLSAQGYIKIYLYHLHPQNQHLLYYHLINTEITEIAKYLPIAPECLPFLKIKAQNLVDIDIQKKEVFGIGMIALESMFPHSTKRYYQGNSNINEYSFSFNSKLLQQDIAALKDIYPQNLLYLLSNMTKANPSERFCLQDIKNYITTIRNQISISGSIKIIEDYENPIAPKISYRAREDQNQSILKSITTNGESRLDFHPIKPNKYKYSSFNSSTDVFTQGREAFTQDQTMREQEYESLRVSHLGRTKRCNNKCANKCNTKFNTKCTTKCDVGMGRSMGCVGKSVVGRGLVGLGLGIQASDDRRSINTYR